MSKIVNQAPDPKSHIKTLMRIGYTLNSAVADVIDNSISAGAVSIDIFSPQGLKTPLSVFWMTVVAWIRKSLCRICE